MLLIFLNLEVIGITVLVLECSTSLCTVLRLLLVLV